MRCLGKGDLYVEENERVIKKGKRKGCLFTSKLSGIPKILAFTL